MKTLNMSLITEAAFAGLFAAAFVMPAAAQDAPAAPAAPAPAPMAKTSSKKAADKVHCLGVNACKGKSACAVEGKSGCNGKNACKGQGWIALSKKACTKKKGTVLGAAASPAAKPAMPAAPTSN